MVSPKTYLGRSQDRFKIEGTLRLNLSINRHVLFHPSNDFSQNYKKSKLIGPKYTTQKVSISAAFLHHCALKMPTLPYTLNPELGKLKALEPDEPE